MKRFTKLSIITGVAVLTMIAFASAQMMGTTMGNSQKETTNKAEQSSLMTMMKDVSNRSEMMAGKFDELETHFKSMMGMNNMAELKKEMQKHYEMMTAMRSQMGENQKLCTQMMSMMGPDKTMGSGKMMGSGNMMGSGGMQGMHNQAAGTNTSETVKKATKETNR